MFSGTFALSPHLPNIKFFFTKYFHILKFYFIFVQIQNLLHILYCVFNKFNDL